VRVGILGAGQLGRMLGFAALELGHECLFVDPARAAPAAAAGEVIRAAYDDAEALRTLAERSDVITYEFENVPVDALSAIEGQKPLYPPPEALRIAQDRLFEKQLFETLDIPLPAYAPIDTQADLEAAIDALGTPAVVKTRRFGYDGKGQFVVHERAEVGPAWAQLGPQPLIAEAWVPFDFEVSVIGVRNRRGSIATWPLSRNTHEGGILQSSRAPVEDDRLIELANDYVGRMLEHLDYVGVLALELFVVDGGLFANEFAPRVHNSGHWTIEGAASSQFSNHILAVTGDELGATEVKGAPGMLNLLGEIPTAVRQIDDPRVHLHDYEKAPRPGRKLGHVTISAESAAERDALLDAVAETVTQSRLD